MSRFESSAAPARASGTGVQDEATIARVGQSPEALRALRVLVASRAAFHAIDIADLTGNALVAGPAGPGRHPVATRPGADAAAEMAAVVMALRRIQTGTYGVRADLPSLGGGDRAVAGMLLAADADAFLVHVAAELAEAGEPALWRHVAESNELAPAADAYRRGVRKGGARVAAALAFAAAAASEGFLDRHFEAEAGDVVEGRVRGLATKLAMSSPAGAAYHDKVFAQALGGFVAQARLRIAQVEEAPALRAAA